MIKLDAAQVLSRFNALAGLAGGDESCQQVCGNAAAEIERRERSGCGDEASDPLVSAAAALAFYRYTLMQSANGADSFEADGVKVTPAAKSVSSARKLWGEAAAAAARYLSDSGFFFGRADT